MQDVQKQNKPSDVNDNESINITKILLGLIRIIIDGQSDQRGDSRQRQGVNFAPGPMSVAC